MNMPLISIITVVYNGVSTLEQTILSVINQTYKNIEYIIIDGGSTDGTVDIIKKYENHLAYWVSESDKGIYDAMNKGIDKATGEWIAMLNSDDRYTNECIISDIIIKLINNKNNIDILHGNITVLYQNGRIKKRKPEYLSNLEIHMCVFHPTCFVRKQIYAIRKYNIKYKIAADYDFLLWCYKMKYSFQYFDCNIVNFRAGGVSDYSIFNMDVFYIWKEYYGIYIATYRYIRNLILKLIKIPAKYVKNKCDEYCYQFFKKLKDLKLS
jgi:glycosyltransferase involved in cell wall biosynthesis